MYREQGNTAEACERTDIDQDTAPRDIFRMRSRPVSGLAGFDVSPSHELEHSQWHQEFSEKVSGSGGLRFTETLLVQSFLFDTPTPAYRCGGSPGIQETAE